MRFFAWFFRMQSKSAGSKSHIILQSELFIIEALHTFWDSFNQRRTSAWHEVSNGAPILSKFAGRALRSKAYALLGT